MVRRECAWDVCVCISYTGDEGQLGSSFLWSRRGGCVEEGFYRKGLDEVVKESRQA